MFTCRRKARTLSSVYAGVQKIVDETQLPENTVIHVRGSVQAMRESFKSFGLGLILVDRCWSI